MKIAYPFTIYKSYTYTMIGGPMTKVEKDNIKLRLALFDLANSHYTYPAAAEKAIVAVCNKLAHYGIEYMTESECIKILDTE